MRLRTKVAQYVLLALTSGIACAQKNLSDLEQAAARAHTEWYRLASDLDGRVARMLPCAASATTAIEDTRRAATARVLAITSYAEAAAERAGQDAALARQLQKSQALLTAEREPEALDMKQEVADIHTQWSILTGSVRQKISLTKASDQLRSIENLVQERSKLTGSLTNSTRQLEAQFGDLARTLEKLEDALRMQVGELFEERGKWNGYYNARLARARAECSATRSSR